MTEQFPLRLSPITAKDALPRLSSNHQILDSWKSYSETRFQKVTLQHYEYEVRVFVSAWEPHLVSDLQVADVKAYVREYERRCQHFRRASLRPAPSCTQGRDLSKCGAKTCLAYQPLLYATVDKHLQALVSLYDFLIEAGQLPYNFVRDVKKSWVRSNRRRLRVRAKRNLTLAELRLLVDGTRRLNRRLLYALLAKTGLRIREVLLLRVDEDHLNLEKNWLRIPDFPGKRKGNRVVIIDFELKPILQEYLQWRERHVAQSPDGAAATNILLLNGNGRPFNPDDTSGLLSKALDPDCIRLGLMRKDERPENRIRPHRFRHFFSDHIKRAGIDPFYWNVLRGDVPRGNEKVYLHPSLQDIQTQYGRFGPVLGIIR